MSTPFAVATVNQARDLKRVDQDGCMGYRDPQALKVYGAKSETGKMLINFAERGWVEFKRHPERVLHQQTQYHLTTAGRVALELREILGPDRGLSVAGAKAILRDNGTRATRVRLQQDGLRKSSFIIGQESTLTEDGERIRAVLQKYNVTF